MVCSSIRGAYCLRLKSGEQPDDTDGDGDNSAQNADGNQEVFDKKKVFTKDLSETCGAQVHPPWTLRSLIQTHSHKLKHRAGRT